MSKEMDHVEVSDELKRAILIWRSMDSEMRRTFILGGLEAFTRVELEAEDAKGFQAMVLSALALLAVATGEVPE